jgi:hypothetical protein
MLPSLLYLIGVGNTSRFVVNSENSIAATKRKSYFVVDMHRLHADFRFSHTEIRLPIRHPRWPASILQQAQDLEPCAGHSLGHSSALPQCVPRPFRISTATQ